MKKQIAVMLFAVSATLISAAPTWAFVPTKITTVTATVTTGGTKVADYTLAIRNIGNPFGANQAALTWSGVNPLSTSWKVADRLLVINSTVTDNNGGIKIYTHNTHASALPQFVDPSPGDADDPDSRAGGLLKGTSGTTSATPLPVAWSIKTSSKVVGGLGETTGIRPREPNDSSIPNLTGSDNPYQWLYMTDLSNWDGIDNNNDGDYTDANETGPLAVDAAFPKMINSVGIHFGQADGEFGATPDGTNTFVYFQANFTGADVLQAYQTSMILVEAFIE